MHFVSLQGFLGLSTIDRWRKKGERVFDTCFAVVDIKSCDHVAGSYAERVVTDCSARRKPFRKRWFKIAGASGVVMADELVANARVRAFPT